MEKSDQRNLLLAFLLMFVVFALYSALVLEPQQQRARQQRALAQQQTQTQVVPGALPGVPAVTAIRPYNEVVAADTAAGVRVALDAPAVDGSISLKGSRIDDVALKGFYETLAAKRAQDRSAEVQLMAPEGSDRAFYAVVNWIGATGLPTEETLWTREGDGPLTNTTPLRLSYVGDGVRIDRQIAIDANYMFTVTDTVANTGAAAINVQPVAALRQLSLVEHMKPSPQAHAGVIGVYGSQKNQMKKYSDLSKGQGVLEEVNEGWIGLTTKYWMAAAVPEQGEPVTMRASVDKANGRTVFQAGYTTSPYTIAPGQNVTKVTRIFAGAKRVSVLEGYEKVDRVPGFSDAVDWSWLWFITKPFFFMLQLFQNWFGSFAIAILALTVVVKTAFFPLQYKMYQSMSKMRKLMPEMESIKQRFGADKQRQQQEMMKLYQQEKVNPLAGCLPLIPQMFVFYALYHTLYVTIEMRHTPFVGWIQDMSAPDPTTIFNLFGLLPFNPGAIPVIGAFLMIGVWPLLYGATMFALQAMSPPPPDPTQRMIMMWLPVVFLIFFATVPAGLVIYWVWSNVITFVQQYIIMRQNGVETEIDKLLGKLMGKKPATP